RAAPSAVLPPCGWPCWSTAATGSCPSAPITSVRTCPPPAASGSTCSCPSPTARTRWTSCAPPRSRSGHEALHLDHRPDARAGDLGAGHRRAHGRHAVPVDPQAAHPGGPDRGQPLLRGFHPHPDQLRGPREATLDRPHQLRGHGRKRPQGHPPQAMLDVFTVRRHLRPGEDRAGLDGLHVVIVGDVLHSRVARSNVALLTLLGARVTLVAPPALVPVGAAAWPCEILYDL